MNAERSFSETMSIEEYFRLEACATHKHDYIGGKAVAMAGGSAEHSLVTSNIIREAGVRLKSKPCRVYDSNLRIAIPRKTYSHYPDAMIICGDVQYDPRDKQRQTATNPVVIFEVLSPTTAGYDRSEKFDHYRELDSFREYILIFQDRREVQTFFKHDDGNWAFAAVVDASVVRLRSLGVDLAFDEIYAGVTFAPSDESDGHSSDS